MLSRLLLSCCVFTFAATIVAYADEPKPSVGERPNVLFIAVDDLRPQLACYGKEFMRTPNFDALARRSVLFEKAYCMVPTCGASRAALMTGMRPSPHRFVTYTARADKETPDAVTLNTHFKDNGYTTISLGKVFHFPDDSAHGWSRKPWRPRTSDYHDREAEKAAIATHRKKYPNRERVRGMPYESSEDPDSTYRDYETTSRAIDVMGEFQDSTEPFFLAVGFSKPHLPFCAPKRYWDLYDPDSIHMPENDYAPEGAPEQSTHTSGELRSYATIPPVGPVDDETARNLIHGYYACVSFIDAQIGRLLESLDANGLAENTIIVLWGDHGWQLGEHGMWNKHSCFETSMHAPLMISAPGMTAGTRVDSLVEFIDIYPSLCELSGLGAPAHLHGTSLVPVLRDPTRPGKTAAVGRYKSGDTIRTEHLRYSEYRGRVGNGSINGQMLYDHRTDPDENKSVADEAKYSSTASELSATLNQIKGRD